MSALAARADPRSSAVLVKEVRAALRGRTFRVLFGATLVLAAVVATLVLAESYGRDTIAQGRDFFQAVYVCLAIALFALVPFSAFTSMGAEWDEGTIELLVTSDLRPRQIVLGKLGAASIEAMLYTSAFAPFLAFAFLMRGVDAVHIAGHVLGAFVSSLAYAAFALWLSCLTKVRIVRVLLLVVLAIGAIALVVASSRLAEGVMRSRPVPGMYAVEVLAWVLGAVAVGSMAVALASQHLAHDEENRSTPVRATTTAWLLVFVVWSVVESALGGRVSMRDPIQFSIVALAIVHVFLATEADPLPRRVRHEVPARRWTALLATPFLPGGARAVLLYVLQLALLFLGATLVTNVDRATTGRSWVFGWSGMDNAVVLATYFVLYVAFGSFLASFWSRSARGRLVARIAIPLVVFASIVVPSLAMAFLGSARFGRFDNALVPFVAEGHASDPAWRLAIVTVALLSFLALAANVPRFVRAVREVLAASGARTGAGRT